MKVLVIGSGGREHALCHAIAKSPSLSKLWCAPGNPGIAQVAECIPIMPHQIRELVNFANAKNINLVIPGPEAPLVEGISDALDVFRIPCCGPSKDAAKLESSKLYTKSFCHRLSIPTADSWHVFTDAKSALAFIPIMAGQTDYPFVIKANGLANGKGVFIVNDWREAADAIDRIMIKFDFGEEAGKIVMFEEFLTGTEASFFALCDGETAIFLGTAQDHKRVGENDKGPNTGGMGAISPAPSITPELHYYIWAKIILPIVKATSFKGILFAGMMITADGPKLLEFNVRFGDPECQAILMNLQGDILPPLYSAAVGGLKHYKLRYDMPEVHLFDQTKVGISVVMAAQGYPEAPQSGSEIKGLDQVTGATIFHAGTKLEDEKLVADGGRVLTVCASGETATDAREAVYSGIQQIEWPEGFYRSDIGLRA